MCRHSCTDIREIISLIPAVELPQMLCSTLPERTMHPRENCHSTLPWQYKDLRALSVLGFGFYLFLMFLSMFFSRYSGIGLLSGTKRWLPVTTKNLLQWHWANPLADNNGSIFSHIGFLLISLESHYLVPVMISQSLTVLASAKSQAQHYGLITSWLIGEKKKDWVMRGTAHMPKQ